MWGGRRMYESFFGLEDAPFRLTPDPRYLFLSKKHEDALAHLKLGLTESGFVCITGDVGTGKTTLLRHFFANLGPDVSIAYIFNPALSLLLHPELVQLNQRITLRWHIGPLNKRETAAYVRHRLSVASHGKARATFTRRAQALIYRLSGGVPRLVNMLAHRALLAAFAAE